ncbi:MAG: DUF2163 domain-containing protein [Pseudomonadota bacterium]
MAISNEFLARLQTGATTTCLCWRLTRTDGVVVAATEHDRAVTLEGVTYAPGLALEAARFETGADLPPGTGGANGALQIDAITDEDLRAGLWNRARVDVVRVDWEAPQHFVLVWAGRFSEIQHGSAGFRAELVSLKAQLEHPVGRIYARRCDAVLGDARCGVDLADPDHSDATCNQTFSTCRDRFQNAVNFRGFSLMPGADYVLSGPAGNGRDGARR